MEYCLILLSVQLSLYLSNESNFHKMDVLLVGNELRFQTLDKGW